ncbi:MAG: hypothetical protein ABIF82_03610 [Planctomycetota bacterium]
MYGAIVRNVTTAGGGPIFVNNLAHNINDAVHCTFIIQDVTAAGAVRVLELAYVDQATGKGANTDILSDVTAAGRVTMDALVVAAHSLFDIGPIVNGITRAAGAVSPWIAAAKLPMRSLHYNVPLAIADGAATSPAVVITHRLPTANVLVFASPTSDPSVGTVGGDRPMRVTVTATAVGTATIVGNTSDNANNNTGNPVTVTWDVMIIARWGSGLHSRYCRQHSTTVGGAGVVPTYIDGDDYSGATGCRQLTPAQAQTQRGFPGYPSYGCFYSNVDGLVVTPGVAYVHNMGSALGAMALVTRTGAGGAAVGTGYIIDNATTVNTMTLGQTGDANIDNANVGFFRPYSPTIL